MFVGGTTYLRANVSCSTDVNVNEVTFYVKGMNFFNSIVYLFILFNDSEEVLVHSKTTVMLEESPVPIFVVSPNHGSAKYCWEYKRIMSEEWESVRVPEHTCLIYADCVGQYRCHVDNYSVLFTVDCEKKNGATDSMHVYSSYNLDVKFTISCVQVCWLRNMN